MLVHQGNEIDGIYDPGLERDYNEIDITRIRQVALLAGKGALPIVDSLTVAVCQDFVPRCANIMDVFPHAIPGRNLPVTTTTPAILTTLSLFDPDPSSSPDPFLLIMATA
jgi:hypothetical protein